MIKKSLKNFSETVKNEMYFEAHEQLEDVWRPIRSTNDGKILKGFINGATALQLNRLGRTDASNRVWKTFHKYRKLIEPHQVEYLNIENLLLKKCRENCSFL